jgi:hypothetical protein
LFGREVWFRLLAEAGFEPNAVTEETANDQTLRGRALAVDRPR